MLRLRGRIETGVGAWGTRYAPRARGEGRGAAGPGVPGEGVEGERWPAPCVARRRRGGAPPDPAGRATLTGVFLGGEVDVLWNEGVLALFRWRRERRQRLQEAAALVREAERWLAAQRPGSRPDELWPPLQGGPPA